MALFGVGLLVRPAVAHQLSVSTGTVVVGRDRITVTLNVPAEDLVHHDSSRMNRGETCSAAWLQQARNEYESTVSASLVIRDTHGVRLSGRVVSSAVDGPADERFDWHRLQEFRVQYILEYPAPERRQFLTFQQRRGDAGPRLESQLALDVRREGDRDGRMIRLTSRGNAETLEFPAAEAMPPGEPTEVEGLSAPDRFKTVFAIIRADEAGVEVEIHMPLTLLETWQTVERRDPEFVEPAEQTAASAALTGFFAKVNQVRLNGAVSSGALRTIAFLPPEATALYGKLRPRRLSAWTARVAAIIRYDAHQPLEESKLTWGLFNNAVLTGRAVVAAHQRVFEHEFSTYEPTLVLIPGVH